MRILIAEGERHLAEMLVRLLKHTGYTTDVVSGGQSCIEWVDTGIYDALILDVKLSELDGFAVSETLRAKNNHIPILMLTAGNIPADRIRGLNNGVDYCLGKPFENAELLACLEAVLRRCFVLMPGALTLSDLTLRPSSLELGCGEKYIRLNARETAIMRLLIINSSQILPKETILVKIWGYDADVTDNSVEAYISFLRKKLALLQSKVQIATHWGLGYRLEERYDGQCVGKNRKGNGGLL